MRENLTSGSTGGSWKRNILTTDTQMNDPAGNRKVHHGYAPYRQVTSPRQLPTQPSSAELRIGDRVLVHPQIGHLHLPQRPLLRVEIRAPHQERTTPHQTHALD